MKNRIVFITKSLCYHQVHISDSLYKIYGDEFCFIQVREPLDFRVAAHQEGFERPYLKGLARSKEEFDDCMNILKTAQVIIAGEVSSSISKKFNKKALLLKYSERIFKPDLDRYSFFQKIKQILYYAKEKVFPACKNRYLLSAGAYTLLDYSKFGLYKNRSFMWGYFPYFFKYDWKDLEAIKNKNDCVNIAWVSRLIKYKHPESALEVAKYLNSKNVDFVLHLVGDGDASAGELKDFILDEIKKNNLQNRVIVHGKLPSEDVLQLYKKCDIALFTTSFSEGWGVGVNEAMNAGCSVVAAHSVGSARYLINNNVNGIIYEYGRGDLLCKICYELALDKNRRFEIGEQALKTILEEWNYEIAADRLSKLIDALLNKNESPFTEGPCSKAPLLKECWNEKNE